MTETKKPEWFHLLYRNYYFFMYFAHYSRFTGKLRFFFKVVKINDKFTTLAELINAIDVIKH